MAVEPIDYARPGTVRREPVRYGPTTTGFFVEVDPSPGNRQFNLILGLITVVLALAITAVSNVLAFFIIAGGLTIGWVERSASVRSKYASFELDAGELIVHHDSRKDVLSWLTIERFAHTTVGTSDGHAVHAVLSDGDSIELFRSDRLADVERVVLILNREKEQR